MYFQSIETLHARITTEGIHGKNRKRYYHPELDQTAGLAWRSSYPIVHSNCRTCTMEWPIRGAPSGFFDRARSLCKHSKSFKRVNMQNKHGGSIRSQNCYLKRCVKNSSTQYSFHVTESRVSSNCTRSSHRPSTPEKEVNWKGNTVGKIA